jgi:hypothetical protein
VGSTSGIFRRFTSDFPLVLALANWFTFLLWLGVILISGRFFFNEFLMSFLYVIDVEG